MQILQFKFTSDFFPIANFDWLMYPNAIYQLRNSESFQRYDVILSDLRVEQVRGSLQCTAFYSLSTGSGRGREDRVSRDQRWIH